MPDIILHHYPQSPVSEKVRVAFGFKDLHWHSVHIPRLPPKPDVIALTGGYRRTPIMQVGADIYCDSLCILRCLERMVPEPSLFPDRREQWSIVAWTDGELFKQAVGIVLGSEVDNLPAEFAADRGRLYFGPDYDLQKLNRDLPHLIGQLAAHFTMMQRMLGERQFMHGHRPGLTDALCYYLVWFIRGRYKAGPTLLSRFSDLVAWEDRVREIGHGQASEMSAEQSLDIALNSTSTIAPWVGEDEPLPLKLNDLVEVTPQGDGGDPPVRGELVFLSGDTVAVRRQHERVNQVVVHFPRIGYRVSAVDQDQKSSE